jgi:preprotein translocase subunit SecY
MKLLSVVIAVCFAIDATASSAKSLYQQATKWSSVAMVVPTAVIIAYIDFEFGML